MWVVMQTTTTRTAAHQALAEARASIELALAALDRARAILRSRRPLQHDRGVVIDCRSCHYRNETAPSSANT